MYLTNYSINKDNSKFEINKDGINEDRGHKRSLSSIFKLLKQEGYDTDLLWN